MSYESPQREREREREELYRATMHKDAVERQERAKVERHACCWEPLTGPHHPVCVNAEDPDAPPPLVEGQGVLL